MSPLWYLRTELQGTDCSFGGAAYMPGPGSHTALPHPSSSCHSRPAPGHSLLGQALSSAETSGSQESPEILYIETLLRARSPQRNEVVVRGEESISNNRSTDILISLRYFRKAHDILCSRLVSGCALLQSDPQEALLCRCVKTPFALTI